MARNEGVAGLPAKRALRGMAPAVPVFAGEPAPTGGRAGSRQAL
ncbi:hypothetical protein PRJ_2517 [Pseudomonas sp. XWY-1]|nr:hypothetical protein PRJ_2517 [Pseudomonas sp. XWY-1]